MKKLLNVLVLILLAVSTVTLTSCGGNDDKFKVGLICLHDESSTYDKNFIDSMYRAVEELGLSVDQLELVTGIGEDEKITISFGDNFICLCVPLAILDSAARGSPCEPVHNKHT